ncbi:Lipoprotein [Candidatus Nitrotoga sp. HW29]|uniref:outer membrane protein assembly factor BamC n=1 Tax=Candidatus Nitrotoga sp. HW29 TaxID=2886963 RepID=UPI001EF2E2FC|nr:outer membrane protein assembly factor BamC [Candidatus Nitrotoga sp. HW29]CAH1904921.1 Lipoprotein [Candidatus Nitrotoga sp. HW29]
MKVLYLTVLFFALLILAGCSAIGIENKRVDYKSAATKTPALEIPPDLTTPAIKNQHTIPGSDGEIVTNFSDFAKGGQVAQIGADTTVLPEIKNVHLERNGTQRWLVVGEKVEKVWPLVKEFWQEQGFIIKLDNPAAGLIETDWTERRAKIQQSGLSKMLGKVFDKLHSSGEQDMYRTRLERSKDGNSSEIYISHRGMEEALDVDKNGYKWRPRPNDPELEASMLQLLMIKLGGTENQVQVGQTPKSQEMVTVPKLQEINGNKIIILNEPFDKSWRKIGLALDQAGIEVKDKDRVSGVYFVNPGKDMAKKKSWVNNLMFWRNDDDQKSTKDSIEGATRYQVTVRENNAGCEVSVLNQGAGKDQVTQRMTDLLYKQLIK